MSGRGCWYFLTETICSFCQQTQITQERRWSVRPALGRDRRQQLVRPCPWPMTCTWHDDEGELFAFPLEPLPATEKMHLRPLELRRQRRLAGYPVGAPTEAEKQDVIVILRHELRDDLYLEAERTFEEATREDQPLPRAPRWAVFSGMAKPSPGESFYDYWERIGFSREEINFSLERLTPQTQHLANLRLESLLLARAPEAFWRYLRNRLTSCSPI